MEKEILTTKEAAEVAGVSLMTIRRWIDRKKLPTTRTSEAPRRRRGGARHLIRRSDLLALVPAQLAGYEAKPEPPKDGDE